MDVLLAHTPIARAIFAHLAYDKNTRSQSATLIAELRGISRAWRDAIPAPPKFCAYVNAREGTMNPAAAGDVIAMRAMFDETSANRWVHMWCEKYDEQSAQIRARFGATCGIEPTPRHLMGLYIGCIAENKGVTRAGVEHYYIHDGGDNNEIIRRLRMRDRVDMIQESPTFSRDLRNIRQHWEVPIESKLKLMRSLPSMTYFEHAQLSKLCTFDWSILKDPVIIDHCVRGGPEWYMEARDYRGVLMRLCLSHIETKRDVKRIMRLMRGWKHDDFECGAIMPEFIVPSHERMMRKFIARIDKQALRAEAKKKRIEHARSRRRSLYTLVRLNA